MSNNNLLNQLRQRGITISLEGSKIKLSKPQDYKLLVESLPHYQQVIAHKKGYVDYRDFTVLPEK